MGWHCSTTVARVQSPIRTTSKLVGAVELLIGNCGKGEIAADLLVEVSIRLGAFAAQQAQAEFHNSLTFRNAIDDGGPARHEPLIPAFCNPEAVAVEALPIVAFRILMRSANDPVARLLDRLKRREEPGALKRLLKFGIVFGQGA